MNYNYLEAMKEDIHEYIKANYTETEIKENMENRDEWQEKLNDDLWICDSVTGNASGSYTFNRWQACEYVKDNLDLMCNAITEFGCSDEIGEKLSDDEFEYLDVTIRCYLLSDAIYEVLNDLED